MNKEASEMSESAYIYDDLDHSEMIESIINSEQIGTKIEILKMSIVIALKENPAKDYHKKMTTREDGAKNTSFSSIASEEIKILVEEYAKKEGQSISDRTQHLMNLGLQSIKENYLNEDGLILWAKIKDTLTSQS